MIPNDGSNRQLSSNDCSPQMGDPGLFGGLQFVYVEDPMAELATCPSILIRQEPEFLEAMLGCEEPNIYHVFGHSPLGFRYLFKCFEQSECCERTFCSSGRREFNMDIIHCNSYEQLGMGYNTPFANFHKPFMCAMGCFCRPEITISINSTKKVVGKAIHIWTCCDPTFECYDGKGHLKYLVSANCCQCILLCPGMIGKSYEGQFDILDPTSNQAIGNIIKEPATFSEMVTDADSYTVNFPPNANAYDKLLLMGLTILTDYQYFETNSCNNNNRRRGLGFGGLMGVGMGYDVGYGGYGGYGGYAAPIRVGVGKRKKRRK